MKTLVFLSLIFALCSCGLEKEKEEDSSDSSVDESIYVYDSNDLKIGKVVGFTAEAITIMTEKGYVFSLDWEGKAYNFGLAIIFEGTEAYELNGDVFSENVDNFFLEEYVDKISKSFIFFPHTDYPDLATLSQKFCEAGDGTSLMSNDSHKSAVVKEEFFHPSAFEEVVGGEEVTAIRLHCWVADDLKKEDYGLPLQITGPLYIQ